MNRRFIWLLMAVIVVSIGFVCLSFWWERGDRHRDNKGKETTSSAFTLHSEVLATPPIEALSVGRLDRFAFSPDGIRLAAALDDCGVFRIYTTDYPPQGVSGYRKVASIPNISIPSNIAWCRESPAKLAFAAHFFAGPPMPTFRDTVEHMEWRHAHPDRFPAGSVSVVQSDKRIERRIVIASTSDDSFRKDIEFPAVDGATNLGTLCWPHKDTMFYCHGNKIFRIDLDSTPPKIAAIYTADSSALYIFHLGFDSANNSLLCFKLLPRNPNQGNKLNYELLFLNGEGQVIKTKTNIPFSGIILSAVYGEDGTKCVVLEDDSGTNSLYYGDLLNDRWQKLPLEAEPGVPGIIDLNAFDSKTNTAIVTIADYGAEGHRYRRWSFVGKREK